jgi:HK97 family phage portal protein
LRIFGIPIPFTSSSAARSGALSPVHNQGWFRIHESFSGAWQRNIVVDQDLVWAYHAVFACITLIAADISKLAVRLVEETEDGLWLEVRNSPAFQPVLRKPNFFQTRIQFWENWILSKLMSGNTYVLKLYDDRGIVVQLVVLNPWRVRVLVSDSGDVFYELLSDPLSGIAAEQVIVPARDIIHDRFNCLYHPLVGLSPIYACGTAAMQGIAIQNNSATFFGNNSMPGGVLTAPGAISDQTADRLKEAWEKNYSGGGLGKLAVLGDGLKFERLAISAEDSQLIEQLKWTGEVVCSTYHVPPYKIGIGTMPTYNNIQALNVEYYSQCLQSLIEAAELVLDEGLGLTTPKSGRLMGTEFDIDNLLRMDTAAQVTAEKEAVGAGIKAPNESRRRFNLPAAKGGDSPYLQQQNFSLEALAKRDAQEDPFAPPKQPEPATPAVESPPPPPPDGKVLLFDLRKALKKSLPEDMRYG